MPARSRKARAPACIGMSPRRSRRSRRRPARAGAAIARAAVGDGPSRIRSMRRRLVADEQAQPERQALDQHRLPGFGRRRSRRQVGADVDGRPVAGRSRRWRSIRWSSSGSPAGAVARNQARPSPASRRVIASASGSCRCGSRRARGRGGRPQATTTATATTRPRTPAPSTRRGRRRRVAPQRARRPSAKGRADAAPTSATQSATTPPASPAGPPRGRQRHGDRHRRRPSRLAGHEPGAEAVLGGARSARRRRPATGRPATPRSTRSPPARHATCAVPRSSTRAAISIPTTSTRATTPPVPTRGSRRAASAASASRAIRASVVSARPSRCMAAGHDRDVASARIAASHRFARSPSSSSGGIATTPIAAPTTGNAAAPRCRRSR